MGRSKYRFKTRAEYELAYTKLEAEKLQHFVALHEILNEPDKPGVYQGVERIIREKGGKFKVALIRPLAPGGGTVLIREKTSTSTFTYVYRFEDWHKSVHDRLRQGLISMDSDEWPLVKIAAMLWDARRKLFAKEAEKAA